MPLIKATLTKPRKRYQERARNAAEQPAEIVASLSTRGMGLTMATPDSIQWLTLDQPATEFVLGAAITARCMHHQGDDATAPGFGEARWVVTLNAGTLQSARQPCRRLDEAVAMLADAAARGIPCSFEPA